MFNKHSSIRLAVGTALVLALIGVAGEAKAASISLTNIDNTSTIANGSPLKFQVALNGLDTDTSSMYWAITGLIRGNYPNPSNLTSVCQDLIKDQRGTDWIASKRNLVLYIPQVDNNGNLTNEHKFSDNGSASVGSNIYSFVQSVTPNTSGSDTSLTTLRFYTVLVKYDSSYFVQTDNGSGDVSGYGTLNTSSDVTYDFSSISQLPGESDWCSHAVVLAAKGFTVGTDGTTTADSSKDAGSGGGSGGSSSGTSLPGISFGDTNGGFTTTDPTKVELENAKCSEFSLTLPGSLGVIDFGNAGILGLCSPRPVLVQLIKVLLTIAYIFFVIAIIYSGIILATADTDDKAATAKKNLTWAVTGAIIVVAANWIVPTVINLIVQNAG